MVQFAQYGTIADLKLVNFSFILIYENWIGTALITPIV